MATIESSTEIRPFHVDVPQEELDDLRQRAAATRWPDKEPVADRTQGAQLAKIQELVRYWGTDYDWVRNSGARRCQGVQRSSRPVAEGASGGLRLRR